MKDIGQKYVKILFTKYVKIPFTAKKIFIYPHFWPYHMAHNICGPYAINYNIGLIKITRKKVG